MDFGLATFILLLAIIALWLVFTARVMVKNALAADRDVRRTIKKVIISGDSTRLDKLRTAVSEISPKALERFESLEHEIRKEVQKGEQS